MEAVKVTDFFIVSATEWWPRKQDNPTRGKICKAYEVRLVFSNGDSVLDRMHYLARGASRNCFLFDSLRMVCKCYEAEGRYTTHKAGLQHGELSSRTTCRKYFFGSKCPLSQTVGGTLSWIVCLQKRLVPHCKRHFGSSAHCPQNFP